MIKSLTREQVRTIKNFGRKELEKFLMDLQTDSFNEGVNAALSKVTDCIMSGVKNTPGIGEKRYKAIITSITQEMNKESQDLELNKEDDNGLTNQTS